jgi:DNA-binding response OmpR family regulator
MGKDIIAEQRILIMEDNSDLRRLYSKIFRKEGFEVYPAATLEEARALLADVPVDIFLCDIHIGDERGTDLLREQAGRLRNNGTRVIVVSGQNQYRSMCEELGVDFYLEKPVSLETLLTMVQRLTT